MDVVIGTSPFRLRFGSQRGILSYSDRTSAVCTVLFNGFHTALHCSVCTVPSPLLCAPALSVLYAGLHSATFKVLL